MYNWRQNESTDGKSNHALYIATDVSLPCHMQGTDTAWVNKMLNKYLNIYFGHQTSFWTKVYTRRRHRVFATLSICYEHGPSLNLNSYLGCVDEFIADVLTDIALDHIIHIYDPRHEVCSDLVGNPEDRFAHDAAHINQRFFTICVVLYIGKGFTIITTLVVILWALWKHKNVVMGYIFRCFEA